MTPERNELCPCGSGKKYKKCCGLAIRPSRQEALKTSRAIAYLGATGWQREQFCLSYRALKKERLAELEGRTRQELAAQNKEITCSKGCWNCCTLYIEASLQECEAIVHYLYQHEGSLEGFLAAYEGWRQRIARIDRPFRKMVELRDKVAAGRASFDEQQAFDAAGAAYLKENLPCPFLADGACSIYEVRPYVCASMVCTTPPDWCRTTHPSHEQAVHYGLSLKMANDLPYFVPTARNLSLFNMPSMVYQILEQGYDCLSSLPGLAGLKERVAREPAVVVKLAAMKVAKTGQFE